MTNANPIASPSRMLICSLTSTQTGFLAWISQPSPSTPPPTIDVLIGGTLVAKTCPILDANSRPPVWRLGCQWLRPLHVGCPIEIRLSGTGQKLALTTVDFRDGLHGMHSLVGNYSIFYNPKSACTSVRNLFFALHGNEINTPNVDPLIRNAPAVFPPSKDRLPEFKINIVRDPYQRLVSAFVDKVASLFYQPQLCTGQEIYRWRFGQDTQVWGNLTFMDFLDYLSKNRSFSDIHFQAQPVIGGDVELVRVEQLEQQLCDVYRRRRPDLLGKVKEFFSTPESHANRSANSRIDHQIDILNPHTTPVSALGEMIKAGNGFSANLLISAATLPTLNALLQNEVDAHGYNVRAE